MSVDRHDGYATTGADRPDGPVHRSAAAERFAVRSAAALLGVAAVGIGFGVLTALVRARWEPMQTADQAVTDSLVSVVAQNRMLQNVLTGITDLGGTSTLLLVLAVGGLWLLLRRLPRLAVYVVLTGAGGLILNPVVKELVARLRPVVETPVYSTGGWSFPSGHAMSSLVCYGVVLLVFAPALQAGPRRALTGFAVLIVIAVGLSRIALGVHYLTDVLAGWLLGSLWLVLVTVAFHRWRGDARVDNAGPLPGDVPPADEDDLRPVPLRHPPTLPHPWRGIGELAVAWVLLVGLLVGIGMLARAPETETPVLRWDHSIVAALAEHRNPALTSVLGVFGELGNTTAVITAALIVAALAVGLLGSWRPVLFLGIALLGEITLFLTTATIVDRDRPQVAHLDPQLPPTASFPSGHVAASLTLYGGTAALLWATTRRGRYRVLAAAPILIPALVGVQRIYAGAHHPTDVIGSVLLASIWTAIAWWVVEPVSTSGRSSGATPCRAMKDREIPTV
ncbi:phosphatase PAP2 family protein [Nocardia gipuzkoensis]|uniref:phosphatase PAP2 family protein n=1 Tax=Nocardia gipuzkoensis TaxID=2749991 RepID=UPI00237E934C|nr:phosphatase PAP2 family protein [Nocardia gipuzkoensis]MDE1673692.1 phosphatase PAP2 family protein [Nocardia gipuzkoensis]